MFLQVNDEVAEVLRSLVTDLVPPNQHLLIDAYCGAGFFAKSLLDKFERVIGIDWDRFAIAAAKENASARRPTSPATLKVWRRLCQPLLPAAMSKPLQQ